MSDRPPRARREIGHGMQLAAFVVAVAVAITPLAVALISFGNTQAAMLKDMQRLDKDIDAQRADQRLVTQNLIDVGKTLTRIDTQLEGLREQKPKR